MAFKAKGQTREPGTHRPRWRHLSLSQTAMALKLQPEENHPGCQNDNNCQHSFKAGKQSPR